MSDTTLSIVVVNWNTRQLLAECLLSLGQGTLGVDCGVVVVDNASSDGSAEMVASTFPDVLLIRNTENLGFARANNQGITATNSRYVLLLNSDTLIKPGALTQMVCFLQEHTDGGVVGPRLMRPDGHPQPYAYGGDPTLGYLLARGASRLLLRRYLHNWSVDKVMQVDWVSGACMMVRRAAIQAAGPLDEHIFMYFEDSEWCFRIRKAGWSVYYDPQVEIIHLGGQSLARNPRAQRAYYASLEYVYRKHYGRLATAVLRAAITPYRRLTRQ